MIANLFNTFFSNNNLPRTCGRSSTQSSFWVLLLITFLGFGFKMFLKLSYLKYFLLKLFNCSKDYFTKFGTSPPKRNKTSDSLRFPLKSNFIKIFLIKPKQFLQISLEWTLFKTFNFSTHQNQVHFNLATLTCSSHYKFKLIQK